jgi:hypothetical protein
MTAQVWLGDLLRAVATGVDARRAAELLGLVPHSPTSPPAENTPTVEPPSAPAAATPAPEPVQGAGDAAGLPPRAVPMLSEWSRNVAGSTTNWIAGPSLPLPDDDQSPVRTPLLAPRTTAAVLHTLLSTPAADGELDVDAVIKLWEQGKPVRFLPKKRRPTLRFGVQVLVDVGAGMELFSRDQHDLVTRIRSVAGVEATAVSYFSDAPGRGAGPGTRRTWRDYRPPSRGSRVLVLSDFGIGGPAFHDRRGTPAEWRRFVATVRRAGCSPVGLVPYPPSRWPAWLSSSMPLLLWDRGTTASRVTVAVRR